MPAAKKGKKSSTRLPKPAPRFVLYRCSQCKGTDVEHARWVDLNTDAIGEDFGSWCYDDNVYCATCEETGLYVQMVERFELRLAEKSGGTRRDTVILTVVDDEIESIETPAGERSTWKREAFILSGSEWTTGAGCDYAVVKETQLPVVLPPAARMPKKAS